MVASELDRLSRRLTVLAVIAFGLAAVLICLAVFAG
jgi:hypothetical protein